MREPDEQLLDEQTIVENHSILDARRHVLLIGQIGIVDCQEALVIAFPKHTTKLHTRRGDTAQDDQRCIAKLDKAALAALVDSPAMTQLSGQAGLPSTADLGDRESRHAPAL